MPSCRSARDTSSKNEQGAITETQGAAAAGARALAGRGRIAGIFAAAGAGIPRIQKVLEAALEPVFRQSRASDTYRRLVGRSSTDPTVEVRRVIDKIYKPSGASVYVALRKACPHLSREEFYWRIFCLHGAVQYVLADVGRIQAIAGRDFDTSNPHVALKYVIPFLDAGLYRRINIG